MFQEYSDRGPSKKKDKSSLDTDSLVPLMLNGLSDSGHQSRVWKTTSLIKTNDSKCPSLISIKMMLL